MESFCVSRMGHGTEGEVVKIAFLNETAYEYAMGERMPLEGLNATSGFTHEP